jgi:hypothetical protein
VLRTTSLLGLLFALVVPQLIHAKPLPQLEELPDIEEVLQRAGWTMTPEMSAAYSQPGDIFDSNNALLKRGADCFDAKVGPPAAYASMEVNRSLEAGVRMQVLVAGARADLGIEKKMVFDTPEHRQIPRLDLRLKSGCRDAFEQLIDIGEDHSGSYVVTESLSAIVQKQECGSFDAKAGTFVVSGDVKVQQSCSQTSLDPVAVAYKLVPLTWVLRLPSIPPGSTESVPRTPAIAGSQASVQTRFASVESNMGIQDRLRQQRCDDAAQRKSVQVREDRIDGAIAEAQSQADEALRRVEADLEACTQLKRGERDECIQILKAWVSQAKRLKVSIPAGVERVETACGLQDAAFEATLRTVKATALGRAQSMLKRLMSADAAGCGEPASSLELMGVVSMSQVDSVFRTNSAIAQCLTEWRSRHGLGHWQLLLNVRFTVGDSGRIVCAQCLSEGQALIDTPLKNCVVDATYQMRLDVSGGPVTMQYPLRAVGQ